MGALYDRSVLTLIAFSVCAQMASIPLLILVLRRGAPQPQEG
jgi:hypothetical protein